MIVNKKVALLNGCNPRKCLVTKGGHSTEDHLRLYLVIPTYHLLLACRSTRQGDTNENKMETVNAKEMNYIFLK